MVAEVDQEQGVLKETEIVVYSEGEYSDYSVSMVAWVMKRHNPKQVLAEFLAKHPEQKEEYRYSHHAFLAYMLEHGYITEVTTRDVHLGSYGRAEIELR